MKIATLVEHFPPKMGSDRRIYELMKRLAEKHEVNFLLVPSFRELCGVLGLENPSFSDNEGNRFIKDGIIAYRIEIPKTVKRLWRKSLELAYILSASLLIFRIIRKLKKINPQIVVLNYPSVYTGLLGFFASKFLRRPCVVDFNDLIAQYTIRLLNLKESSIVGRTIIIVQNLIVKNSDLIIAPTNFIKEYALALGVKDKNILVIPNGVDLKIYNPKTITDDRHKFNLSDEKVCLYFGRFDDWAGVHILEELGNIFEQKRSDVKFLMVGGGAKKKFSRNVILIKEVPHDEIPKIISVVDVVLVPFPENEVSHAASPLKLFEAMAMAKPVVASKVCGICEIIQNQHNGLLVNPHSLKEWFEAINTVLDSKAVSMKLSQHAVDTVKKYDWSVLAAQLENALSKIEKDKPPSSQVF